MAAVEPSYFTCTLGQAKQLFGPEPRSFKTVLELIDGQAKLIPQEPALGFASIASKDVTPNGLGYLTFRELARFAKMASKTLRDTLRVKHQRKGDGSKTIGLFCTSSLDFILMWLGLMRLGYTVLFLAPQLEPEAIVHLCSALSIDTIFADKANFDKVLKVRGGIQLRTIPLFREPPKKSDTEKDILPSENLDTAYYSHTSGTSSGLPKPIPQPQSGMVEALPRFTGRENPATFTTTPLYHGGLPDCLRAWTSGAMIWLFPEGEMPITSSSIQKAVRYARTNSVVPVKYFSSVPFVLQTLSEDEGGISMLRSMELVGIGGAALSTKIGDALVNRGVKLLSRMGSVECGFLMSSHRNYDIEKDWEYFRVIDDPELLQFEHREADLFELVIKPGWPLRVKTNREDGSYATADLFRKHSSRPNTWCYHSRADSQITLANGKKFDPAPMESEISSAIESLQDVLIFGSGHHYPGILLFPASADMSESIVINSTWPLIQMINEKTQSHARIPKQMVVVVTVSENEPPLRKSSKGTILRRQAEERYQHVIDSAYTKQHIEPAQNDDELLPTVMKCFCHVLGREIDPERDIYRQGVDSIACIQIRNLIETSCFFLEVENHLPLNVLYETGTIEKLVQHLLQVRHGEDTKDEDALLEKRHERMLKLVDQYSHFSTPKGGHARKSGKSIVLTGATGFLGAHILYSLCEDESVDTVYCLVRAQESHDAAERVLDASSKYGLDNKSKMFSELRPHIFCLPCNLDSDNLGLSEGHRRRVEGAATHCIHAAWTVNFNLHLDSFEDQLSGTRNMLSLAVRSNAQFIFISSTAAVSSTKGRLVREALSEDPSEASPMGYSESKWVAENICAAASDLACARASIIRVGQLCGNSSGIWNTSEAYPLMLSTAHLTGCLPDLQNQCLDWLPVEAAAKGVLEIAFHKREIPETEWMKSTILDASLQEPKIYHLVNTHRAPTWTKMLDWIRGTSNQEPIEIVSPAEWVQRLEAATNGKLTRHPSQALLSLWRSAYGQTTGIRSAPSYETGHARYVSPSIRDLKPLNRTRVMSIWDWVKENVQ